MARASEVEGGKRRTWRLSSVRGSLLQVHPGAARQKEAIGRSRPGSPQGSATYNHHRRRLPRCPHPPAAHLHAPVGVVLHLHRLELKGQRLGGGAGEVPGGRQVTHCSQRQGRAPHQRGVEDQRRGTSVHSTQREYRMRGKGWQEAAAAQVSLHQHTLGRKPRLQSRTWCLPQLPDLPAPQQLPACLVHPSRCLRSCMAVLRPTGITPAAANHLNWLHCFAPVAPARAPTPACIRLQQQTHLPLQPSMETCATITTPPCAAAYCKLAPA